MFPYSSGARLDLPPQIVAIATQGLFALSVAGIKWGVMSTSWAEEEEGSLVGAEQFGKNVAMMRDGLARGRAETAEVYAERDAADEGIIMSKRMQKRVEAMQAKEEDSK